MCQNLSNDAVGKSCSSSAGAGCPTSSCTTGIISLDLFFFFLCNIQAPDTNQLFLEQKRLSACKGASWMQPAILLFIFQKKNLNRIRKIAIELIVEMQQGLFFIQNREEGLLHDGLCQLPLPLISRLIKKNTCFFFLLMLHQASNRNLSFLTLNSVFTPTHIMENGEFPKDVL